jgi:4-carboxymuconolactone decarboxylase
LQIPKSQGVPRRPGFFTGDSLRFNTTLPKRLWELAIAITGRRWSSHVEWWVHARGAAENGIAPAALGAFREGRPPRFAAPDEAAVSDFVCEIQLSGRVSDATYRVALDLFGVKGLVELTALVGYYTMVSMTLNAHGVPLPAGEADPLDMPPEGLFPLASRQAP